jgi:nitroreductase
VQASFYGSVLPAVWSFMLAARARGLGSAWTTMHLFHEREAAEILGIPYDEVTQVALLPLAHVTGEGFKPGPRNPLETFVRWDSW